MSFLDASLNESGPNSVLYICFGSEFSSPTPKQASFLFDAIENTGLWVLYASSNVTSIHTQMWGVKEITAREMFEERMKSLGGRGMTTDWVEQYDVLQHEVSGH